MKTCFKCGLTKMLSEFYKHSKMADGHLNKCKECTKLDRKNNYDANVAHYNAYDKVRNMLPERVEMRERYRKTEKGKEVALKTGKDWVSENRHKRRAQYKLQYAVKVGLIKKPNKCSKCDNETESQYLHGHHADYNKPLDVEWLCAHCHRKHHNDEQEYGTC